MDILQTLQALNACHGPAGDESQVAAKLQELAAPYVDECTVDTLGNLICRKKGSGPKVMFAAHMDSIGFIVTHIDDKGFLRFGQLGGLPANDLPGTPVRFKNGTCGTVAQEGQRKTGDEPKKRRIDDLFLDIGAEDRAEAEALVQIGDTAVYDVPARRSGERIFSPYTDNRISCVVLLMALERLKESSNDLYFVFTVQEELGLRGARTAAYGIDPDYGIAVDVTVAGDTPEAAHGYSSAAGKGAAIKVMDNSVVCHPAVVARMEDLAKVQGIAYQRDVIRSGGTDAGAIHQTRRGVYTGGISIPCRYTHSPVEMVDCRDVEACAALVAAFAQDNTLQK